MACERQLDFYLPVPVMDVFNYVASQKEIYKMKLAAVDRANFKVFFKHRANMLTWGEHITISFYDPQDGGCRINRGIQAGYGDHTDRLRQKRRKLQQRPPVYFVLLPPALKRTGPVKQDAALALRGVCGGACGRGPRRHREALGPKKKTEKQHIMAGWSFHPACFYRLKILKAPAPACPSPPHK